MVLKHPILSEKLQKYPSSRTMRLDNAKCIYCNIPLTDQTFSKEHVIGRPFVPKGKLDGQWNLIVNACKPCNVRKSNLEDDISAITMQPDLLGAHYHEDPIGAKEARRKAGSAISRRTGKAVSQSHETLTIDVPFAEGVNFTFNFTGPAQIDEDRLYELARFQLTAFFYYITYNSEARRGRYWKEGFHPLTVVRRDDWGNEMMRAFADAVVAWEPRIFANNADGFFKVVVRKHPDADCWSWGLEWNHSTRVVGFFGSREVAKGIASSFPLPKVRTMGVGPDRSIGFRTEVPLKVEEDRLFELPDHLS